MVIGVFGLIGLHVRCLVVMGAIHEQGYVTILHLLEVICALVMILMDVWRMSLKSHVMKDHVKVK